MFIQVIACYWYFIPFYCRIIFHYVDIPHAVYPVSHLRAFVSALLIIMNSAAMNIPILFFFVYENKFLKKIWELLTHNVPLVSGVQLSDLTSLYVMVMCIGKCSSHLSCNCSCSIIDCILSALLLIPWFAYSITRGLNLPLPFTHFAQPFTSWK